MVDNKPVPVLITDIGGTNSRMSITKISSNKNNDSIEVCFKILKSQDFKDFKDLLTEYLKDFKNTDNYPHYAVIAIPGPVIENRVEVFANLNWKYLDGNEISKLFKIKKVVLLNDFVINGYGVLSDIKQNIDYVKVNNRDNTFKEYKNSPIGVIGPGTGLGHGYMVKPESSKYHNVFASEGGHQSFAPQNELENKYKEYLKKYFNINHVSQENAITGPSLPAMYNFFFDSEKLNTDIKKNEEERKTITPEEIVKLANEKKCEICITCRKFFIQMLATTCSNYALAILPLGGLYLFGGVSLAFKDYIINDSEFINKFYDKGILSEFLKTIPIYIITNPKLGIKGSSEYGRRLVEEGE